MHKPFTTTLMEMRGGALSEDMAKAVAEVTEGVRRTGKPGTVTMVLRIEPASEGDSERVMVGDTIAAKVPKLPTRATMFYADKHNNLSRNDPQQAHPELVDLKAAPAVSDKLIMTPAPASEPLKETA